MSQMEITLSQADEIIECSDALQRLYSNPDFKKVFLDRLLTKEPVRLTYLLAEPNMRREEQRAGVIKDLEVIAGLQSFMRELPLIADMARRAKQDHLEAELEIEAEGGEMEQGE